MSLSLPQIQPTSEDFGRVEYLLQLNLHAPCLKVSECYDISLRSCRIQFDTFVKGLSANNIIDIFVPANELQQTVIDIASHGIRVNPKNGFKFIANSVNLQPGKETYDCVHMKVALGSVINYENPTNNFRESVFSDGPVNSSYLAEGFNSLCLSKNYEYCVFQNSQVYPIHYVRFNGGDNLSKNPPSGHQCAICKKENATLWCENDSAKLCDECDKKSHSGNPLMSGHKRLPLQEAIMQLQMCPFHSNHKAQYYCPTCHLPVCLDCKIKGNHSKGDASKHLLVDLGTAYNDAIKELSCKDSMIINREKVINEQLLLTEKKIQEISINQKSIETEISRIANKAIEDSKVQTIKKAQIVKSVAFDLQRKLQEIADQKNMIIVHKDHSEPLKFLQAYYRNKALEKHVTESNDLPPTLEGIFADLTVYGRIEVSAPKNVKSIPKPSERSVPLSPHKIDVIEQFSNEESQNSDANSRNEIHITALSRMAIRKESKYLSNGLKLAFKPFDGSAIIGDPKVARMLYMCFPFRNMSESHLLFSSERDGKSIQKMHRMIDGVGVSVIIVKSGEYIFGGFAASKWNSDGVPFGKGESNFLFSLTRDAFIPYNPQSDDPMSLYGTPDTLSFGKHDLKLSNDFASCSSSIENSYGVGYSIDSDEAKQFLAGVPKFKADIVEVWGFFSSN